MRHIGDRIRKRREQLGLSQSELARQLGLKPQSIQQWEDGRAQPRPKRYAGICEVLNISRAWLLSGSNDQATKFPTAKLIPLISWAQAGQWDGAVDMYRSGYAQEWAKAAGRIGARTFALRVEGEAMEPQFPPGAILFVDPDMTASPGDFVIAQVDKRATFKQLVRDSGVRYLKPLHPQYPIEEFTSETRIVGVVVFAERRLRN